MPFFSLLPPSMQKPEIALSFSNDGVTYWLEIVRLLGNINAQLTRIRAEGQYTAPWMAAVLPYFISTEASGPWRFICLPPLISHRKLITSDVMPLGLCYIESSSSMMMLTGFNDAAWNVWASIFLWADTWEALGTDADYCRCCIRDAECRMWMSLAAAAAGMLTEEEAGCIRDTGWEWWLRVHYARPCYSL